MTMPEDLPPEHRRNYGIPARTPASTALWAHLLKKDTLGPLPNSEIIVPPITPLDKNGTSMRILLHDTQAQLDKFSDRVDKLCSGVDEAKREISMVNTLFQREHETLTGELVDLVNRSQTRLQTSIGTPAQAEQLGILSKDINTHLEALDKRIDAIQLFNQTHSQTLQLQSQALQTLQEQHGTVLAALMPLLPLLQAIPLYIESSRNSLAETITKSCGSSTGSVESPRRTQDRQQAINRKHGNKRSSSTLYSDDSPTPPAYKKPRLTTNTDALGSSGAHNEANLTGEGLLAQPIRTEVDPAVLSNRAYAPQSPTPLSLIRQESTIIPSPHPLPLADSNGELLRHTPTSQTTKPHPGSQKTTDIALTIDSTARLDGDVIASSSPHLSEGVTPSAQRPPCILHVHSLSSDAGADTHPTSIAVTGDGPLTSHPGRKTQAVLKFKNTAPSIPRHDKNANYQSAIAQQTHGEDVSPQKSKLSTPSVTSRLPLMLQPLNPPNPPLRGRNISLMLSPGHGAGSAQDSRASTPTFSSSRPAIRGAFPPKNTISVQHIPFLPPSPLRMLHNGSSMALRAPGSTISTKIPTGPLPSTQNAPLAAKVRERRSPFRVGRRFILLGDSEDDDDDDGDG